MTRLRVAVVGAGTMAAHHARVIAAADRASVAFVVDRDEGRARRLARLVGATATTDLSRVYECDAAVVATATSAHAEVSLALIDAGLAVLVEKPLTPTLSATRQLVDLARTNDVVLVCGLVERFNPAVARLNASLLTSSSHIRAVRIGPTPLRVQSSVVDDVLLHDLDLVLNLTAGDPVLDVRADAQDWSHDSGWPETVTCRLGFASGMTASLHASRVATTKVRSFVITDERGHEHHTDLLATKGNPLGAQFEHFVDLVLRGTFEERELERHSVLPGHELAHRVQGQLAEIACGS